MTFSEKYGDSNVPHKEKYGNCVADLGLDRVRSCIPWTKEELTEAYKADEHFNSLSIDLWDAAAGFRENHKTGVITRLNSPLMGFLKEAGVTSWSYSELVCILKEAARQVVSEAV